MNTAEKTAAQKALKEAGYVIRQAVNTEKNGNVGEALRIYRSLFGPKFPLL